MRNRATKMAINNAVYMARCYGILKPKPCEKCGATDKIQAHHPDYNKPLSVQWLCQHHHLSHHSGGENAIQPLPEICDKTPTFYYKLGIEQMGGKFRMTGKELRQWRETLGLTQIFMANLLGVSHPAYKRWESEDREALNVPQPIAILISLMDAINPEMKPLRSAIPA